MATIGNTPSPEPVNIAEAFQKAAVLQNQNRAKLDGLQDVGVTGWLADKFVPGHETKRKNQIEAFRNANTMISELLQKIGDSLSKAFQG